MDRRRFLLTSLAGVLAAPLAAGAQEASKKWRIGLLSSIPHNATLEIRLEGFRQRLRELGYEEGRNITLEYRYPGRITEARSRTAQLSELVADLVRRQIDVIVTWGQPGPDVAQRATRSIPIVVVVGGDELYESLRRPGGNATGLSSNAADVVGKQLELFKQVVPSLARVAVLKNPAHSGHPQVVQQAEEAARLLGLRLVVIDAGTPGALPAAFRQMVAEAVQGVLVLADGMFVGLRPRISDLANSAGLPSMFAHPVEARAGGLIAYGTDRTAMFQRAAVFVDKILKGANPANLPVEQPTKFELVINLKTAKALRLTIPPSLLARADQMIE
jgi:putative ABC transport system substrate-binding protein